MTDRFALAQAHLLHTLKAIEAQGLLTSREALSTADGIRRGVELPMSAVGDVVEHDPRQMRLFAEARK
jgi:hypothetical protein